MFFVDVEEHRLMDVCSWVLKTDGKCKTARIIMVQRKVLNGADEADKRIKMPGCTAMGYHVVTRVNSRSFRL